MTTRRIRVEPGMPTRLDALVRALLPRASRRLVRRLVAEGAVRVNGRAAAKGAAVAAGDVVELPELDDLAPDPSMPLAVLHEDADLVAVDKPGGVRGHALDPRERGTVAGALLARHPELARVGDPLSAGLVHRLDTGTSGVLVAARTPASWDRLRSAFREHAVTKTYVAIVVGTPRPGVVDTPLAHDPANRRRMRAARPGDRAWAAATRILALETYGDLARVTVEIRTGVTHQVRAHLALAGHPVVGDTLYGAPPSVLPPTRHALHAATLELPTRALRIEAALPADLRSLLDH